jgi:hypothetical protein
MVLDVLLKAPMASISLCESDAAALEHLAVKDPVIQVGVAEIIVVKVPAESLERRN